MYIVKNKKYRLSFNLGHRCGVGGGGGIGIPGFIKKNWGFGFQSIVLYSLILL